MVCQFCGEQVPDVGIARKGLLKLVSNCKDMPLQGWVSKLSDLKGISNRVAEPYLLHLQKCPYSWPYTDDEELVLRQIDEAFGNIEKPTSMVNCECPECTAIEEYMLGRTPQTLWRRDISDLELCFCNPATIAYFMPTVARLAVPQYNALIEDVLCRDLMIVYQYSKDNWLSAFSPNQQEAFKNLIQYLQDNHPDAASALE